jgi:hypothetical protein
VAYGSVKGRKPIERASKIAHGEIINNPLVQAYLEGCTIPKPADPAKLSALATAVPPVATQPMTTVIAIDGGYTETPVRSEYPSASITFFNFGPLLFKLKDLEDLDQQPFIAPEDIAKLKQIQRYTLVLPTKNVSRNGKSLHLTIRETLQEFFEQKHHGEPPIMAALRWILFRGWITGGGDKTWLLPNCPNAGCDRQNVPLTPASPDRDKCSTCGGPIFLVDALRLHERVDEEQGAGGILGYVMTSLEQLLLAHLIKTLWEFKPAALSEVMFIKDGPLAFFGQTAPLSKPMRELAAFLGSQPDPNGPPGATVSFLNVAGLEKSGAFVEHAQQIHEALAADHALILSNDYIYRYIVPGDPTSGDPYGQNTYWGGKLIYKASDGNVYVATVPTVGFNPSPKFHHFPNLAEILAVIGKLRCSMYDNALIPIALANKLVSLSDFPSARILETFAKDTMS